MVVDGRVRRGLRWVGAAAVLAAATYGTLVAIGWCRYGHASAPSEDQRDPLLDDFMPSYDVVERHRVDVLAPAAITFATAAETDITGPAIIRAVFKARELLMGSAPEVSPRPRAFLEMARSIGWGVLVERPGEEIVLGAITQPWLADVVFRPLPPAVFRSFNEPGFVKIAWTLRADAVDGARSIFRTETRAIATDPVSRAKFRWYWSRVSPGVFLIRRLILGPIKGEAERRARAW